MKAKFGDITTSEIEVMLTAASEDGNAVATSILDKQRGCEFDLTPAEAEYLRDNLWGDADRVAEACGDAAGHAFERAGNKLAAMLKTTI